MQMVQKGLKSIYYICQNLELLKTSFHKFMNSFASNKIDFQENTIDTCRCCN